MLKDIHDVNDTRCIKIDNVGITKYKLPTIFVSKEKYSLCNIQAELENYESIHEHNVYARGRI